MIIYVRFQCVARLPAGGPLQRRLTAKGTAFGCVIGCPLRGRHRERSAELRHATIRSVVPSVAYIVPQGRTPGDITRRHQIRLSSVIECYGISPCSGESDVTGPIEIVRVAATSSETGSPLHKEHPLVPPVYPSKLCRPDRMAVHPDILP
jgi:hypothetical protein